MKTSLLVPLLAASGVLAAAWAVGRAAGARRLEAGLSRMGEPPQAAGAASARLPADRLGTRILATRGGALLGRRIAAALPSAPPARAVGVAVLATVAGALVPVLLGHPGVAPAGAPAALALAARLARRQEARRTEAIERQLPDVLALQAGALAAGHSVVSSLASVARESGPPLGPELVRCAAELDLGVPLEEALAGLARRCGTRALQPWIAALLAGRATGGDITRALTSLAGRARDRARLRSELRALTAQGRLSGTVVSLAPVAFLALMAAASRQEAASLYGTGTGLSLLAAGALLDVAGLVWIRRIAGIRP